MIFASCMLAIYFASFRFLFWSVGISSLIYGVLKPIEMHGTRYWLLIFKDIFLRCKKSRLDFYYTMSKAIIADIKNKEVPPEREGLCLRLIERNIEEMRKIDAGSPLITEIGNELFNASVDVVPKDGAPLDSEITRIESELGEMDGALRKDLRVQPKDILSGLLLIFLMISIPVLLYIVVVKIIPR